MRISDWSSDVCSSDLPAEPISESAHGLDDIVTECPAQVMDVHVDRVAADLLFETVQAVLELFAGQAAPARLHQAGEQCGLATRQVDGYAVEPSLPTGGIQRQ